MVDAAWIGLGAAALLVVAWVAHLWFWGKRLHVARDYALREVIALPDGGAIELRRLPRVAKPTDPTPVLLIHGLAMNEYNQDGDRVSLARFLAEHGRDVWLLTLRSGRVRRSVFGPANADFASMAKHDYPAAVREVLERTGANQLDVVGFSMGGMLTYATLDRTVDSALVRRVVILAGPARIRPLGLLKLSSLLPRALAPTVPLRLIMRTLAFLPRWLSRLLFRQLYNADNIEPAEEQRMNWNVWEDIPGRLGADFVHWSANGGAIMVDGAPVLPGLAQVSVPVCFFAGRGDWLAPIGAVRAGFDAWGAALPAVDKTWIELSLHAGARSDYGHCDVSFGANARDEVFVPTERFLATGAIDAQVQPAASPAA